jgi:hypothetical protein
MRISAAIQVIHVAQALRAASAEPAGPVMV